jgi:hypothetical protein
VLQQTRIVGKSSARMKAVDRAKVLLDSVSV